MLTTDNYPTYLSPLVPTPQCALYGHLYVAVAQHSRCQQPNNIGGNQQPAQPAHTLVFQQASGRFQISFHRIQYFFHSISFFGVGDTADTSNLYIPLPQLKGIASAHHAHLTLSLRYLAKQLHTCSIILISFHSALRSTSNRISHSRLILSVYIFFSSTSIAAKRTHFNYRIIFLNVDPTKYVFCSVSSFLFDYKYDAFPYKQP
jgi:hypothetical protein